MNKDKLESLAEMLKVLLPFFLPIGIYLLNRTRDHFRSSILKLDVSEKICKLVDYVDDEDLKKVNVEYLKDELFFLRTTIPFKGRLRKAFSERFEDLTKEVSIHDLHFAKSYFLVANGQLCIKSTKAESLFVILYWGTIALMLLLLTGISIYIGTSKIIVYLSSLLTGLSCLPIVNQILVIVTTRRIRVLLES